MCSRYTSIFYASGWLCGSCFMNWKDESVTLVFVLCMREFYFMYLWWVKLYFIEKVGRHGCVFWAVYCCEPRNIFSDQMWAVPWLLLFYLIRLIWRKFVCNQKIIRFLKIQFQYNFIRSHQFQLWFFLPKSMQRVDYRSCILIMKKEKSCAYFQHLQCSIRWWMRAYDPLKRINKVSRDINESAVKNQHVIKSSWKLRISEEENDSQLGREIERREAATCRQFVWRSAYTLETSDFIQRHSLMMDTANNGPWLSGHTKLVFPSLAVQGFSRFSVDVNVVFYWFMVLFAGIPNYLMRR